MQRKKNIFGLFLSAGLVVAGAAALSMNKAEKPVEVKATFVEPNDVFNKIYDDSWNNTSFTTGFNHVLLCFTGTANGLDSSSIYDASVLNNILLDGAPLYNTAACVIPWGSGQNWFRVVYPTSMLNGEGTILEIKNGTAVGDSIILGFTLRLNSSDKWEFNSTTSWAGDYVFTDPVNSTYSSIYSGYNNSTHTTGYNRLMFVYTGTAHNHPTAITSLLELKKYDGYITIDGNPISTYQGGSTQIAPWNGQLWIQLIYPETAVSVGSILTINSGCKIGDAVFDKIVFKLNSSSQWEKLNLIEDDPLVKTADYLLFTPSDLGLNLQNDTIPYYGDLHDTFLDSFGFQFNVNIPSADVATTISDIRIGATDIYGNGMLVRLFLNDATYKFGMFFNSNYDWTSYKAPASWDGDVTHLVEFYAIKSDSTHMVFLLGIDGSLLWKTNATDISAVDFTGHTFLSFQNKGTTKSKDIYSSAPTVEKALNRFGANKLNSETIPFSDHSDTGACLTKYAQAKAFYNTYLTNTQRIAFASESAYANLRERFQTWAEKNGETISFNTTNGELVSSRISTFNPIMVEENKAIYFAIIVASIAAIAAFGLLVIVRRKKNN